MPMNFMPALAEMPTSSPASVISDDAFLPMTVAMAAATASTTVARKLKTALPIMVFLWPESRLWLPRRDQTKLKKMETRLSRMLKPERAAPRTKRTKSANRAELKSSMAFSMASGSGIWLVLKLRGPTEISWLRISVRLKRTVHGESALLSNTRYKI